MSSIIKEHINIAKDIRNKTGKSQIVVEKNGQIKVYSSDAFFDKVRNPDVFKSIVCFLAATEECNEKTEEEAPRYKQRLTSLYRGK